MIREAANDHGEMFLKISILNHMGVVHNASFSSFADRLPDPNFGVTKMQVQQIGNWPRLNVRFTARDQYQQQEQIVEE